VLHKKSSSFNSSSSFLEWIFAKFWVHVGFFFKCFTKKRKFLNSRTTPSYDLACAIYFQWGFKLTCKSWERERERERERESVCVCVCVCVLCQYKKTTDKIDTWMPDLQIVSWADKPFAGPEGRAWASTQQVWLFVLLPYYHLLPPSLPSFLMTTILYLFACLQQPWHPTFFLSFNPMWMSNSTNHHHMMSNRLNSLLLMLLGFYLLTQAQEQIISQVFEDIVRPWTW
jgi:hypothetical protein